MRGNFSPPRGGGGGSLRISSDGDHRRILGGLKFSIREFFWVRPFCEYILGGLFYAGAFLGIQKNLKIRSSARVCQPGGLSWKPLGFFWSFILAAIRSSRSLEIGSNLQQSVLAKERDL